MKIYQVLILFFIYCLPAKLIADSKPAKPIPAANLTQQYVPSLLGLRIAMVVNQTSTINQIHLVDSLRSLGIHIEKIFAPEHGFRGDIDAGATVLSGIDSLTGISIVSLYGDHKKPTKEDLQNCDLVLFDIQDVGVRFYTYLSTLHLVMEACAENALPLIVLDRPNPNGSYIDGPVLDTIKFKSFVGMHPVPIVYGMTIGEYANMINGEKWLSKQLKCNLTVIPVAAYDHSQFYTLPIKPSPNLVDNAAIIFYPSLCLFEGTVISVGRGTYSPFKQIGHPLLSAKYTSNFTPQAIVGMSVTPPYLNQICYGIDLQNLDANKLLKKGKINLYWILELYRNYPNKKEFFNSFFNKLAGNEQLKKQIIRKKSIRAIRHSWKKELANFKKIRAKYILYP
jgi:uncharacterized protein YbbC (DUF1343 family)